jgi:hypothetical protein
MALEAKKFWVNGAEEKITKFVAALQQKRNRSEISS